MNTPIPQKLSTHRRRRLGHGRQAPSNTPPRMPSPDPDSDFGEPAPESLVPIHSPANQRAYRTLHRAVRRKVKEDRLPTKPYENEKALATFSSMLTMVRVDQDVHQGLEGVIEAMDWEKAKLAAEKEARQEDEEKDDSPRGRDKKVEGLRVRKTRKEKVNNEEVAPESESDLSAEFVIGEFDLMMREVAAGFRGL